MRIVRTLIFIIAILFNFQADAQDWRKYYENTNFEKYKADNEKVGLPEKGTSRVVFMGNSITEVWPILSPHFFENGIYIGRGISGQTTPQMILRFRKDVINLQPKVVVILAGINDIAENTGFTPIDMIAENIMTMAELAQAHDMKVIICSVTPAIDFPWKTGLEPANKILELNTILERYAEKNDLTYVDYHTALKDKKNGLKVPEYTTASDLVHPNAAGYKVMESLIQPAIEQALAAEKLSVSPLFSNQMVLQRNEKVAVWGKAKAGQTITVSGTWGIEASATTDNQGNWNLKLSTPEAGGPFDLNIKSADEILQIKEVMVGEVWLASGQSNMQMPLKGWAPNDYIKDWEKEIANADYPNIRMFTVNRNCSLEKQDNLTGKWEQCSPKTVGDFSATAYFFARRLQKELNIPIGIIHSSWGGTPAEAWTSMEQIKTLGDFDEIVEKIEDPKRAKFTDEWFGQWKKMPTPTETAEWNDIDLNDLHIAEPSYKQQNWSTMELPGRIDLYNEIDIDGAFWFRKTIELEDVSTDYTFVMGAVDDTDAVFFNGKKIGGTVNNYVDTRNYPISKSLLKKGKNTIAIRIIDTGGPGNITGDIKLTNEKGVDISLIGNWDYTITSEIFTGDIYQYDLEKVKLSERPDIIYPSPYATPAVLYNGMINPLIPYTFKGAIWYQGESNVGFEELYKRLFPTMIKDWRTRWNAEFPFYFVQIAPFKYLGVAENKSQALRDAQRSTLSLNETGMVVTLDIGDNENIHPANKQDIGIRLAGLALANDYGKNIVASGPLYKKQTIKGKNIWLEFDQIGSGLMAKTPTLTQFEIAGADKNYVPAIAMIKGDKIKVSAPSISNPMYVRYAWRDTSSASLFNKEGLPASSFTTED
jgi:sialate O-acetylesterase